MELDKQREKKWGYQNKAQRTSYEELLGARTLTLDVGALSMDTETSEKAQ